MNSFNEQREYNMEKNKTNSIKNKFPSSVVRRLNSPRYEKMKDRTRLQKKKKCFRNENYTKFGMLDINKMITKQDGNTMVR